MITIRIEITEETVHEHESRSIELSNQKRRKKEWKKKYRPREYVGNIKRWNILIIGVASKEKRENGR